MDEKFDVFIAYHGNKYKGSEAQAQILYEKIKDIPLVGNKRNHPYFHPAVAGQGFFTATPEIVGRTPLFLLVTNKNIPRDGNGYLKQRRDDGTKSPLYEEVCAFRNSLMHGFCTAIDVAAAKLFITDDFNHTQARQLHHIFSGTTALNTENEVIDWIQDFYRNRYPSVLYNRFTFLAKHSRDDLWRSDWVDEAEFYWQNCRIEGLGKSLLIFYYVKYTEYSKRTDKTALETVRVLCTELLQLHRKSGLRPDTYKVLMMVMNRINM